MRGMRLGSMRYHIESGSPSVRKKVAFTFQGATDHGVRRVTLQIDTGSTGVRHPATANHFRLAQAVV